MRALVKWIRFGTIREEVRDTINGLACEVAYIGRFGKVVGYWAYGHYDHTMPYRGI